MKKNYIMISRIIIAFVVLLTLLCLPKTNNILAFILFIIAYIIIGWDVVLKAIKSIVKGKIFNENFLMTIATLGAIILQEYPEAIAVILFYQIGEFLLDYSVDKSKRSIERLMDIRPDYANLENNGKIEKVSPELINIGDIVVIKPGEKIPLDGIVMEGESTLNSSALTGESNVRFVGKGMEILSGCVNLSGLLKIKVTKNYSESTVSKILDLVENASTKKAKTENFITKFAAIYTPIVVISAALLVVVPTLFFSEPFFEWFERTLIFLVISCPCALVISVPLSFFGGIGGASKNGILIKGGNYIEVLNNIQTMVFDKTGTLTKGEFIVTAVHANEIDEEELLKYTALVEKYSNHPIALSIKSSYKKHIDASKISEFREINGRGVEANIDGKKVSAGNSKLMADIGANWEKCDLIGTIVHVAIDGKYMGHIVITDKLKDGSLETISQLKKQGIEKIIMMTGDSKEIAEKTAERLNVDEVYSELLPTDKGKYVQDIIKQQNKKKKTAFIGDGINDAPVLMLSDIGIAMGGIGSDVAIEAADVVLMDDNPYKIVSAMKIAKKTVKIVKQNIIFSLAIKILVLILGAIGIATMWWAVFADVGVTLIVVLNASRAMYLKNLNI